MLIFLKDRKKISYELYFYFSAKKDKDPNSRTGIHEQCIGEYSGVTRTLYLQRCGKVYWRDGKQPKDRTIKRVVPTRVNMTIYVALCIICALGIILAISFLIINIKFRHQK